MTNERHFFTDTASATLKYAGDGDVTADSFDPLDAETVTLDTPWTDFFDTDEFVQFDATVAQPITQPYLHDGQLQRFRKREDELKRAQAQIDNLAWTKGHPPKNRVTSNEEIRGFWTDPRWNDGQEATLNIPANDPDAVRYAIDNGKVSMGFSGDLDWTDDEADAAQTNITYDHIASVEVARCPPEQGCGIHDAADSGVDVDTHGNVFSDSVRTQETDETTESSDARWSEGDWVSFTVDGERRHGKIRFSDDERTLVAEWDPDEQELSDESRTLTPSDLNEWVGPFADSCPGDTCSCGCHGGETHADSAPAQTSNQQNDTDMSDIYNFIDEHDLSIEDVIDTLEVDPSAFESVPDEPTDFYDGQPDVETLADDFDSVALLQEQNKDLSATVDSLREDLREARRPQFADKAEKLAAITHRWGDEDDLLDKFETDDEDERWTVDTIEEKLELVRDIRDIDHEATTADSGVGSTDESSPPMAEIDTTPNGKADLRRNTR